MIEINKDDYDVISAALAALIHHNGGESIEISEDVLMGAHRYSRIEWEHDPERGVVKVSAPINIFVLERDNG